MRKTSDNIYCVSLFTKVNVAILVANYDSTNSIIEICLCYVKIIKLIKPF